MATTEEQTTAALVPDPTRFKSVHEAVAFVQSNVGSVSKTGEVSFGSTKFKHMQEHGLIGVLRPLLIEACLTVTPSFTEHHREGNHTFVGGTLTVGHWPTGQIMEAGFYNEGVDNQDKGTNKALTGWMKYALQKFFLVPTQDLDDNETVDTNSTATGKSSRKASSADARAFRNTVGGMVEELGIPGPKVIALNQSFGVERVDQIPKDKQAAFLERLRQLGNAG